MDKDREFWINSNKIMIMFFILIAFGGLYIYASTVIEIQYVETLMVLISYVFIGLAFAVLNKGRSIKTEEKIERIEKKLDKILEHRDDVLQNK